MPATRLRILALVERDAPLVFPLAPSNAAQVALTVGALSLGASVLFAVLYGAVFIVFVAGAAPALWYLLAGAPRAIEVHSDRVLLRRRIGGAVTLLGAELTLQRLPDELVLVTPRRTYCLEVEVFVGRHDACAEAIAAVAAHTIVKEQLREQR